MPFSPKRSPPTVKEEIEMVEPVKTIEISMPPKPRNPFQTKSTNSIVLESIAKKTIAEVENAVIENNARVIICYTTNHYSLFIRSMEKSDDKAYSKVLTDVNAAAIKSIELTEMPEKNDIVAAYFEGGYYRAVVIKTESTDKIRVAFIDFGNVADVSLNEIRKISDGLKSQKRYAVKCFLDGANRDTDNPSLYKILQKNENVKEFVVQTMDGSSITKGSCIKLIDPDTKESIVPEIQKTVIKSIFFFFSQEV